MFIISPGSSSAFHWFILTCTHMHAHARAHAQRCLADQQLIFQTLCNETVMKLLMFNDSNEQMLYVSTESRGLPVIHNKGEWKRKRYRKEYKWQSDTHWYAGPDWLAERIWHGRSLRKHHALTTWHDTRRRSLVFSFWSQVSQIVNPFPPPSLFLFLQPSYLYDSHVEQFLVLISICTQTTLFISLARSFGTAKSAIVSHGCLRLQYQISSSSHSVSCLVWDPHWHKGKHKYHRSTLGLVHEYET